ncbi:MAG: DUF2155 domain-containing protein [Alphaproteobacteria bacterium]|nr:DUF2155 domain-containing protein [Alphaproteobacteria bacterium]
MVVLTALVAMAFSVSEQVALAQIEDTEKLHYEEYPTIRLRSLDKVTARTLTFDAQVGTIIKFGDIYIKILSCRKPPPVEKTESAAFMQIWEVDKVKDQSRWIFSGWMFASSPALSAMDHPVYDVWVMDCLGKSSEAQGTPIEETSGQVLPDEGAIDADKAAPLPSGEPPQDDNKDKFGDVLNEITADTPTEDVPTTEETTPLVENGQHTEKVEPASDAPHVEENLESQESFDGIY